MTKIIDLKFLKYMEFHLLSYIYKNTLREDELNET